MSQGAVISAVLELQRGNFRTEQERTTQELGGLQTQFRETGGAVAVLERQLKENAGNQALRAQLTETKKAFQELGREIKVLENQKARLDKALATSAPVAKPADDSERYHAAMQSKAEERERERRARAAQEPAPPTAAQSRYEAHRQKREEEENLERRRIRQSQRPESIIGQGHGVPTWDVSDVNPRAPRGGGHGDGGHGGGGQGQGQAAHSVRAIFDMMGAGQDFGQASKVELPRLLQASGKGLGTLIGIEAAVGIITGINTAVEKAREFKRELAAAFSGGGVGVTGKGALRQKIGEVAEMREKIMPEGPSRSIAGLATEWLSDTWKKVRGKKTATEERDDQVEALEQKRIQLSSELARRKEAEVALEKRAAVEGEAAVAIDRERLALKERIAAVNDDTDVDATARARMIASLREESRLREDHIHLVQAQAAIEAELRRSTADHRLHGDASPVTTAEEALQAATKKRDAMLAGKHGAQIDAVKGSEEYKAADVDVTNRQADLNGARTAQAQQRATNTLDANAQGSVGKASAHEIEGQRLRDERANLMRQIYDEHAPDYEKDQEKRKTLGAQLGRNGAAQAAWDRDDTQRVFQRERQDIAADTGVGTKEKLAAIERMQSLVGRQQADNDNHEKDVDVASRLNAEAAELKRQKSDILFAEQQSLDASRAQTAEMALQQGGHGAEAQILAVKMQYHERILQAQRDGKNELAAQLTLQQNMAVEAARLANYRRGPAGEMHDRLQAQADARDKAAMYRKHGTDLQRQRQRYEDDHRADLPADAAEREKQIAAAVPDTWQKGVAAVDPQQQHSADDSNAGDVVDVLENIHQLLDTRLRLEIP